MAERTCTEPGCARPHHAGGRCKPCYRRAYYREHREHELARMAQWREANREYDRARWAAYYADNADRLRQAKRDYEQANRAEILAKDAIWREANRELLRARNREQRRNDPNWPLRNRENAQRRAKAPDGSKVDYVEILAEHGMVCHLCGGEIESLDDLHMDHVTPLSRGGAHSPENIRPSHAICNMRKGARLTA